MAEHIEITVSDGSDDHATGKVAERSPATGPGRHRYIRNTALDWQPAVVVHRPGFERDGLFDTKAGKVTDTDIWVRLFSRYGVRCVLRTICAYMTTMHRHGWDVESGHHPGLGDLRPCRRPAARAGGRRSGVGRPTSFTSSSSPAPTGPCARGVVEGREVLRLFELPEVRRLGRSP